MVTRVSGRGVMFPWVPVGGCNVSMGTCGRGVMFPWVPVGRV